MGVLEVKVQETALLTLELAAQCGAGSHVG